MALSGRRRSLVLSTGGTMTEILTESFCERCGTRYTFETAAPRRSRLGRVRVASKGLRNYVMQDESSFSEAMADARSDVERSATTHQLDAFHKTFNFCMTCRQYTCGNCWNAADGRCLTCSPLPEVELPAIVMVDAIASEAPEVTEPAMAAAEAESWPEADLGPERLARAMGLAGSAAVADAAARRSSPERTRRLPTSRRCEASRRARAWRTRSPSTRHRSRRRRMRRWTDAVAAESPDVEPEPVAAEVVAGARARGSVRRAEPESSLTEPGAHRRRRARAGDRR